MEMDTPDDGIRPVTAGATSAPAVTPLRDETLERENIMGALKACRGHRERAAAMLNVNPATLYRKMKKYGIK